MPARISGTDDSGTPATIAAFVNEWVPSAAASSSIDHHAIRQRGGSGIRGTGPPAQLWAWPA